MSASKDLSFRRETNIESDDHSWLKALGICYVVPQQHHAVGGKNSSLNTPFVTLLFVINPHCKHAISEYIVTETW